MARVSANPKKFIISCRINHDEMEALQERAEACGVSITDLLRKSLELSEIDYANRQQARA